MMGGNQVGGTLRTEGECVSKEGLEMILGQSI